MKETNFFILKNRDSYDKLVRARESYFSYLSRLDLLHEEDWQKAFCDKLDLYDKLQSNEIDETEYMTRANQLGHDIYQQHEQEELDVLKEQLDQAEQEAGYVKPALTLNLDLAEDVLIDNLAEAMKFYARIKPSCLTEHAINFFTDLSLKDGQVLVAEQIK